MSSPQSPSPGYLGLDLGTTQLKAAVFGAAGDLRASASVRLDTRIAPGGIREQSGEALLDAVRTVAGSLQRSLGEDWGQIAGIGLAAQGGSACLCDRDTGQPLMPVQLWNDRRHRERIPAMHARLTERLGPGGWPEHAGRGISFGGLARLAGFAEERPQAIARGAMAVGVGELLFFFLTGQWRQDAGHAQQTDGYSPRRHGFEPALLEAAGLTEANVSPMRQGHALAALSAPAAQALALPEGLPVAGPYMDHEAGFLGSGAREPGTVQCSLGTAWVANYALPDAVHTRSMVQIVLPPLVGAGPLIVQPLLTGNAAWDWALQQCFGPDHAAALQQALAALDASLLPTGGLVCFPCLGLDHPLAPGVPGSGSLIGLGPDHSPAEVIRAVALGLCCELKRVCGPLITANLAPRWILTGGAARGRFFQTLLASLLAPAEVFLAEGEDWIGCRGALHALCPAMPGATLHRIAPPDAALTEAIDAAWQRYQRLYDALYAAMPVTAPIAIQPALPTEGTRP